MLFLVFTLGNDRYAIDAALVAEVLPLVNVKQIPKAPAGIAGILNYHGVPIPLIDLAEFVLGKPSLKRMSTRILVVNFLDRDAGGSKLGLMVEQASEIMRRAETDFKDTGIAASDAPYLGPVTTDAAGMIQRIDIQKLLSESVRNFLFGGRMELV